MASQERGLFKTKKNFFGVSQKSSFIFNLVTSLRRGRGFTKHYPTKIGGINRKIKMLRYAEFAGLVSVPRSDRFLLACQNSKTSAKKLYRANLRVSQAFYPILNLFEVILRNRINDRLTQHFQNPNWITVEKTGFMSHQSLRQSRFFLKNQVTKAERKMRRQRVAISTGKVIAEQSFGFWTSLFEPHHYRLLAGSIIQCFPDKPPAINRSSILVKLQRIKNFRNRVYHNEPVCFLAEQIDFSEARAVRQDILDLSLWIGPDAHQFIVSFDNTLPKIILGERI